MKIPFRHRPQQEASQPSTSQSGPPSSSSSQEAAPTTKPLAVEIGTSANDTHDTSKQVSESPSHYGNPFSGKSPLDLTLVRIDSSTFDQLMDPGEGKSPTCWGSTLRFCKKHSNYYRLHLLHFFITSLLGGCLIYATERHRGVAFIDAYFTSVSAMCVTGLSTTDVASFTIAGQIITFIMIILGSAVLTSAIPQVVRWYYYRSYAKVKNIDVTYFRCSAVFEFLSVESLLLLIPFYFLFFQFSAFIMLTIYFAANPYARGILEDANVNFVWFSLFHSVSAFNNAGFGLLSTNLVPFDRDPYVLLVQSVLILAGNTAYPVFLRAMLWCVRKATKSAYAGFDFLWRFPRQSFTHLFTYDETLILLYIIIGLTLGETILSLVLDWNKIGRPGTPGVFRVVDAFFQATSTRTAGFQVTDLSGWNPGMLMVTIGAMYLSSYPLTIAIRSSNRKEEDFYDSPDATPLENKDTKQSKRQQAIKGEAQRLLLNDFTFIFLGMVLIQIIEADAILSDFDFSSFKVIFEVISAYGTVGLTMGYPGVPYSFSGDWRTGSKLVLIGIMLLGRHRGLPDSVDKALRVPVEKDTTVPEFDEDAVRVHRKDEISEDFPQHKVSKAIFSTALFHLDADTVVKKLYTTPNLNVLQLGNDDRDVGQFPRFRSDNEFDSRHGIKPFKSREMEPNKNRSNVDKSDTHSAVIDEKENLSDSNLSRGAINIRHIKSAM